MIEAIILAFMNMTRSWNVSLQTIVDTAEASIGINAFFSILVLSFTLLGYTTAVDKSGMKNIATAVIFALIGVTVFSFMLPPVVSILLWVLTAFAAGGTILWKVAFKKRGEY